MSFKDYKVMMTAYFEGLRYLMIPVGCPPHLYLFLLWHCLSLTVEELRN